MIASQWTINSFSTSTMLGQTLDVNFSTKLFPPFSSTETLRTPWGLVAPQGWERRGLPGWVMARPGSQGWSPAPARSTAAGDHQVMGRVGGPPERWAAMVRACGALRALMARVFETKEAVLLQIPCLYRVLLSMMMVSVHFTNQKANTGSIAPTLIQNHEGAYSC